MASTSFTSKIMDILCAALIAPASKIGMPKDFYFRIEDRQIPVPAEDDWHRQRDRLFVNLTRRKIVARLSVIATCLNTPIILLLIFVFILL